MIFPFLYSSGRNGKGLLLVGGVFIVFGSLITVYPQILVWLISSLFFCIGLILFGWGMTIYQASKKKSSSPYIEYEELWKGRK